MTQTFCLQSEGRVLKEATYINKSLSFLEQAIIALGDQKRDHIPFRQCKLTHALKDSLGKGVVGKEGLVLGKTSFLRNEAHQTHGRAFLRSCSSHLRISTQTFASVLPLVPELFGRDLCGLGDSGKGPLPSFPSFPLFLPGHNSGSHLFPPL